MEIGLVEIVGKGMVVQRIVKWSHISVPKVTGIEPEKMYASILVDSVTVFGVFAVLQ